MTIETARKIVDNLVSTLDKDEGFLNKHQRGVVLEFIGGEPLLYPDLIDQILEYFFARVYEVRPEVLPYIKASMSTNGLTFKNKKVQELLRKWYGILEVSVSIDGVKELHDAHRVDKNGNGSFDRAFEAFNLARKMGFRGCKMTFVPESFPYIFDSLKMMLDLGLKTIFCNCAYEPKYTYEDAHELYLQLRKVADYLIETKNDAWISILDWPNLGTHSTDKANFCGGTKNMIAFDPDGNAYPCLRFCPISIGEEKAANIQIGDLDGIWSKPAQIKIKDYLEDITAQSQSTIECNECPISSGCGWCSGYNYEVTGDPNKRVTNICNSHKGRVLAKVYYYNVRAKLIGDVEPFHNNVPIEEMRKILSQEEIDELTNIERLAFAE